MCTLVHHGILKFCLVLPQLSSLWPLSKLTVFHVILLSFKCNDITAEADRMQFSKDLVSFPSLPGRLMCSDDPCIYFLRSCCKKSKKIECSWIICLGWLLGDGTGWEDELTSWVEALFTACVSNAFICFLTFYFYSFLQKCYADVFLKWK